MQFYDILARETRGELDDLIHLGYLSIVDEHSRVVYHVGDPDARVFFRSASKPLQALPVIARELDKQYGLTEEETVLFAGSHAGEPFHFAAIARMMQKTGFSEDLLVMKPTTPHHRPSEEARIRQGLPSHKYYHNCAGKHIASLLLQRALGAPPENYWQIGAACQQEIERTLRIMSETDDVQTAVDGCGVPVFAVGMKHIAIAFKNLAYPQAIADDAIAAAATTFVPRIHDHPLMMRGTGYLCSLLNCDENIVAKGGANGVYGFALKKEKLGVAFKLIDGTEQAWPLIVRDVLDDLGALSDETRARLDTLHPDIIRNDNESEVGRRETTFHVAI